MNERIKKMRRELGFTQQRFADELGMKQNTIATYEMGRAIPSDSTIKFICYKFGINETWLRTGEGEMFAPEPAFDLSDYVKRHGMTELETEILKAYLELDLAVRENLLQHFKERLTKPAAAEAGKDIPAPASSGQERTQADLEGREPAAGTPASVAEAEALYEKSLGIAPNTGLSALNTTGGTESRGSRTEEKTTMENGGGESGDNVG